jgi:hypothetical protein
MGKQVDKNDFWFIEKNPITKVGVYPYLGKQISQDCEPDKIYYVLRPKEELFRKETLDSLRLIPLIDGHTMIGKDFTAPEDKGLDGTLGDNVSHDTDTIYNDLKIISNKMKEEIKNGKKELSLGYFCRYDKQPGTYKGQRYDYVQRDIIANHLALVDKGRMGADVRVYDSQNIPEGEAFAMDSIDISLDKEFNESDVNRDDRGRFATKTTPLHIEGEKYFATTGLNKDKVFETLKSLSNNKEEFELLKEYAITNAKSIISRMNNTAEEVNNKSFAYEVGESFERKKKSQAKGQSATKKDMALDDEDIEWITVRGTHVPIKKGESKEQAVKNFLAGKKQSSGSKAELKKGDKIRFADTQGVEYKFVGENRGMLEFENIEDDSDKKGFPKGQLEERLKDGSMQIFGSKAEKEQKNKKKSFAEEYNETYKSDLLNDLLYNTPALKNEKKEDIERFVEENGNILTEENSKQEQAPEKADNWLTGYSSEEEKFADQEQMMKEFEESDKYWTKKYKQWKEKQQPEQAGKKTEKEEKLTESTTTTKNTSKSVIKTMVTNKAFFDNRINDPAAFKREMNYAFNGIYGELTEYERKEEANFDDIYETAVKHYLKAIGVPERLANHKNFGTINRISKFADQNKMLKGKDKEGFNEFLTEVFINYADEEDKGTPNINRLTERAIKQYKDYNSELKKSGQKKFGEDSREYKTIQGEGKMADKKEKVAIDEDKRKLIDEIGGILKEAGIDDELIRTVIGKAEKIAYNKSEAGDDGEEVEEEEFIDEEEENVNKKPAKDKCGKDEEEDDEDKEEEEKKKVVKAFAQKEKLGKEVEDALGTFDHSEMTELEIAKYACDKLDLEVEKGQEISAVKGYLKGLAKAPKASFGYKTVAADSGIQTTDAEFEKFINKGE